jgi:hypothetical protein
MKDVYAILRAIPGGIGHAVDTGFRTGLQFQVTLVMQGVPELDAILMNSLKPRAEERLKQFGHLRSFFKSVAAHVRS